MTAGFTLIELSIVLVIIGLIVGGVLAGQDLIRAAEIRSQISQIEKYNTAVNTFRLKYNGIPGDILPATATAFGFALGTNCDGSARGFRNGDGLLDPWSANFAYQGFGEVELFWADLSSANLIPDAVPNASILPILCNDSTAASTATTSALVAKYLPSGKIGGGTFVYVYDDLRGANWYGLSAITGLGLSAAGGTGIPVIAAYNIDKKIDDGVPTTGVVKAIYISSNVSNAVLPTTTSNSGTGSSTSCYDTVSLAYATGYSGGTSANCALSFKFQ